VGQQTELCCCSD